MEIYRKKTFASSAARTEIQTLQFLFDGYGCAFTAQRRVSWGGDHFFQCKATGSGDLIMGQKVRAQKNQVAELEEEPEVIAKWLQRHCFALQKATDVPVVTYTQRKIHKYRVNRI